MKHKFIVLSCCAALLLGTTTNAQTSPDGNLTGNVIDEQKKPLDYVSVALLNAQDSTLVKESFTSREGNFAFEHLPKGNYLIAFNMIGYSKVIKGPFKIDESHKGYQSDSVQLTGTAKQLKSVNITGRKPLVERQVDKTVLNIENSILAAGNTALEILKKAPGVSVDKDGNISLQGKKGVNIMIDGKLTYLSSEEVTNLLAATEGNSISTIELITNPSSKYDAAGNSGIINIKLKKNRNYGTNGTATAGAGYGKYYKANGGVTLNHRDKRFNFFGDFNYSRNKRFSDQGLNRINTTGAGQTFFNQTGGYTGIRNNTNYKTGLDYFIDDHNTLGLAVNGYITKASQVSNNLTRIGENSSQTDSIVRSLNPTDYTYKNTAYNLNYKGVFDTSGQEINIDADFSRYHREKTDEYNNTLQDPNGIQLRPTSTFRNTTPSIVRIWAVKADYTYPFSKKMKLDLGLKTSFINTDNNSVIENLVDGRWQYDQSQSNHFLYDENINAAYANFNREFKSTTVQVGLRAEQTNSKGNSITTQSVVKRHYFDLFPSIFINQVLSSNHTIGFSYSRRIDRPNYSSLNPFIHYIDSYTYSEGNPFLKPQYTNSLELSWSYRKIFNASLGYSATTDVISFVTSGDTIRKTLHATTLNLSSLKVYNLNISSEFSLTKWWTINNNLTIFYNNYSSPDLLGSPFKSRKLAFNFNSIQTFTIDPTMHGELSGYYHSKTISGAAADRQEYSIDMGLNKTLMDNKLNIKLAANDIFNILRSLNTSTIPGQIYTYRQKDESRIFRLTAAYRFGSNTIKGARKRTRGSEEEQKRI